MKAIKKTVIELSNEEQEILGKAQYIWNKIADELDSVNYLTSEYEELFDDMNEKFSYLFYCLENGFKSEDCEE